MLTQDSYNFYFNKHMCIIYFKNKIIARAFLIDDLYHLHMDVSVNINEQTINIIGSKRLMLCLVGVMKEWMDGIRKMDDLHPSFGLKSYKKNG